VVAVWALIKFGLDTLTVAPGTAAPAWSTTVPSMDPVVDDCANALSEKHSTNSDRTINLMLFFMLN
jgi:hypothetical protein